METTQTPRAWTGSIALEAIVPIEAPVAAAEAVRLGLAAKVLYGVGEIANSLGLARGTAHGIIRTLERVGFLEQDEESGKYQLGAALLSVDVRPGPTSCGAVVTQLVTQSVDRLHRSNL